MNQPLINVARARSRAPASAVYRRRAECRVIEIQRPRRLAQDAFGALGAAALTVLAVVIHGYHPFAEDGGLYVSGILKALHPLLYPGWPGFVTAQFHFSLFTRCVAAVVRGTGLGVEAALFALYLLTIWATLFAAWLIARRCYPTTLPCYCAICLLALWLTMPIAGTSLLLMDPYVTARSISTPCGLFAIAGALEILSHFRRTGRIAWRPAVLTLAALLAAALVHPLMAGYALACVALVLCSGFRSPDRRTAALTTLCLSGVALAAIVYSFAPAQTTAYAKAAQTRTYWFLSQWRWFEIAGLFAPVALLGALTWLRKQRGGSSAQALARMAIAAGASSIGIALLFARIGSQSYEVARLQPLRIYQTIYVLMILALGAFLAEKVLRGIVWRWAAAFLLLGGIMFWVQHETFPKSRHIELPWTAPRNPWEQGFAWVDTHTSPNALFALDANYITAPGEDSQNFEAIAERSALPDYSKDGGIASIARYLADSWTRGVAAQSGLDAESDASRLRKLQPLAVTWVVLTRDARTSFDCPYANSAIKVCRLPQRSGAPILEAKSTKPHVLGTGE